MASTLKSASVYLRKAQFYVHPLAGSSGGDPALFMEPVTVLEGTADAAKLGDAVLRALQLSHHHASWPIDWKGLSDPLLRAAGVKSESTFMKGSRHVRVNLDADTITVITTTSKIATDAASPLGVLRCTAVDAYEVGKKVLEGIAASD